jgi:uncharacterized protein with NAD-binding domain and iron-sulfur cluster
VAGMTGEVPAAPEHIVIVGGGMSALTTAYHLTDPALNGRYTVSIYTMGWRLGGKGASGRNAAKNNRIEEHGLHIWFGTYHNAIALMRRCYAEMGRPAEAPLATFDAAFKGQSHVALTETVNGAVRDWMIDFPELPVLGHAQTVLTLLRQLLGWILNHARSVGGLEKVPLASVSTGGAVEAAVLGRIAGLGGLGSHNAMHLLDWLGSLLTKLDSRLERDLLSGGLKLLAHALWALLSPLLPTDDFARRAWILSYLAITFGCGIIDDRLVEQGFAVVDDEEFRAWLKRHSSFSGAEAARTDPLAFESPCVQTFYDASFSYLGGEAAQPNVAAGVGLRAILRIMLDYSGPIILEMQAGMGDTVFTPLYLLLKQRSVSINFFHRLTGVNLDATGSRIESLELSRQVTLKGVAYDPLVTVKDLPCWLSVPDYSQIVEGKALQASGANLEHWNSGWTDRGGSFTLKQGAPNGFSRVVLAISYALLPQVTVALASNTRWAEMIDGLGVTNTVAAQLWFARTAHALGRTGPSDIIGAYREPWSSLSDFTHLLGRECWPAGAAPACLYYTCGPIGNADPPDEAAVFDQLQSFLAGSGVPIFRGAEGGGGGFDWNVLFVADRSVGADRLQAQYWRVNSDPTEQYVISTANTPKVRLRADQSGFDNLVIAGEWVDTVVNISSIEATVIAGMRAARAISGQPETIIGESDL